MGIGATSRMTETFDAIILGAGGAGLMCAAIAGQHVRDMVPLARWGATLS